MTKTAPECSLNGIREAIRTEATAFRNQQDLQSLIDRAGKARYVLLGEASHGTADYYTLRAAITKRLMMDYGFRVLAVEGDWPSCYTLNRYIKGDPDAGSNAAEALRDFRRWPTWMWANQEIADFAEWLRAYNADKPDEEKAGFYGMDVYSLWESLDAILAYLGNQPGRDLERAKRAFACFDPYQRDEQSYGISASLYGEGCEEEVVKLLRGLQDRWKNAAGDERDRAFNLELNAMAVQGAETYYRTMIRHDSESWNVRDRHMAEVVGKLADYYGDGARAVIWAHNTHIGDARATDMAEAGEINLGQLLRERHGREVYAVGFGSYSGEVIAGSDWGAPPAAMEVPPAVTGSWEALLHEAGSSDKLFLFEDTDPDSALRTEFIGHRAVGVVYHPWRERGNYVPTVPAKRYDAFLYLDRTDALHPLSASPVYS